MAEDVKIEINVEGNAEKVIKTLTASMKDFGSSAESGLKKSTTAFDVFQGALGAGVALKALETIADGAKKLFNLFVVEGIAAAQAQEDATLKLNSALAQTGQFSAAASKELQDFSTKLSQNSKFADEVVQSQLATAISFGATTEQAKKLVQAAADLASQTGGDLDTAVHQLGQTLNGTKGALAKTIPGIKELTDAQLAAGAAIDLVAQKFAGAAGGSLQTFSGSVAKASNAFGEVQEAIGLTITQNPAVIAVIDELGNVFGDLSLFITDSSQSLKTFVALVVNFATDQLATFSGALAKIANFAGITALDGIAESFKKIDDAAQKGLTNVLVGSDMATQSIKNQTDATANLALKKEEIALKEEENLVKEIEARIAQNEALKAIDEELYAEKIAQNDAFITKKLESLQKGTDAEIKLKASIINKEKQIDQQRIQNLQSTFSTIATLQQNATGELFLIGKAAAIATATIDGIAAVQKALASAPPPFNFALAALVGVATAANVAKIASAQPPALATGASFVEGQNGVDKIPAFLSRGERVFTTEQNKDFSSFLATEGNNSTILGAIFDRLSNLENGVMVQIGGKTLVNTLNDEIAAGQVINV